MATTSTKPAAGPPNASMRMSAQARAHMRATEKVILRYYNDMGKNRGNCTWGPGILAHKGVCNQEELVRKVTRKSIDLEFERRVSEAERYVKRTINKVALNQAQFDALVSLTYNLGVRNMKGTYDYVNSGDFEGAANNISRMIKVTIVEGGKKKEVIAPGLIKRRSEESAPFRIKADSTASK